MRELRTAMTANLSRVRRFGAWAAATAAARSRARHDTAPLLDLGECLDPLD
jgi:hypothetical protein